MNARNIAGALKLAHEVGKLDAAVDFAVAKGRKTEEQNQRLRDALTALMQMDVKGHQLQDRLQFSTPGRVILEQCRSALAP